MKRQPESNLAGATCVVERGAIATYTNSLLRVPCTVTLALGYILLAAALAYFASMVAGTIAGFALPSTAIFRWLPSVRVLSMYEYNIAFIILSLAALGIIASCISVAWSVVAHHDEERLLRFWSRWGVVLSVVLFVFSISGPWAGVPRQGDFGAASIGGLVPFSDAISYFAAPHDQLKDGIWNESALRRPLAAAFRSVMTVLGLYSYNKMLLLQAVITGVVVWWAAQAVARWRGIWAGLTFFALMFIVVRTFLPSSLTEPLGLIWALISIPFFVSALRKGSLGHAFIAFAITVVALVTRMGVMFMIPALMVWLVLRFGKGLKQKIAIGAAAIAIVGAVWTYNLVLQKTNGSGQDLTGSNFSYTLCGLSIGQIYSACVDKYSDEFNRLRGEADRASLLYKKALENIHDNPGIFLARILDGAWLTVATLPNTMFQGYLHVPRPSWFKLSWLQILIGIGLCYAALYRREKGEFLFWTLVLSSIPASGALIFFDDGMRAMAATYPLVAVFLASGMTTPAVNTAREEFQASSRRLSIVGATVLTSAAFLFLAVPWSTTVLKPLHVPSANYIASLPNQHAIAGGSRVTGFLVVADDEVLPVSPPALHLSDFVAIVRLSGVEIYQGLVTPIAPPTPFGFITAPRLEKGALSTLQYIVPPEVVLRRDVPGWRLSLSEWQKKKYGNYWFLVTRAEPIDE